VASILRQDGSAIIFAARAMVYSSLTLIREARMSACHTVSARAQARRVHYLLFAIAAARKSEAAVATERCAAFAYLILILLH